MEGVPRKKCNMWHRRFCKNQDVLEPMPAGDCLRLCEKHAVPRTSLPTSPLLNLGTFLPNLVPTYHRDMQWHHSFCVTIVELHDFKAFMSDLLNEACPSVAHGPYGCHLKDKCVLHGDEFLNCN